MIEIVSMCACPLVRGGGWTLIMRVIKCLKGIRWMPWRQEAMKDVIRCDKPWGAANKL